MKKFLLLYLSPVSAEQQIQNASPEDMQKGMEPWVRWFDAVNACGILRPDNFDRPFVLSSSVKNHLAPSGLERQHWCANQCDPNADQCAPAEN